MSRDSGSSDGSDWRAQASGFADAGLRHFVDSYLLTNRERDIIVMVLRGMSNKEIASQFAITEQTVKDHLKHVYGKVGVHQRTALCAKLLGLGRPPA